MGLYAWEIEVVFSAAVDTLGGTGRQEQWVHRRLSFSSRSGSLMLLSA